MNDEPALLENIKKLAEAKNYRIRLHAVRHMIEEGFYSPQKGQTDMSMVTRSKCWECGGQVRRKAVDQEFKKQDLKVKLSGPMRALRRGVLRASWGATRG
jgi:hypothetical protein